jgi:hypothetical protein
MAVFEEREAEGESVWSTHFSREARVRLKAITHRHLRRMSHNQLSTFLENVQNDLGLYGIELKRTNLRSETQLLEAIGDEPDKVLPSLVEALCRRVRAADQQEIAKVIREERIAYRVVDGQLYPFESLELHEEVVAPTIRLLAGRNDLSEVEEGYQKALKEIGTDPADAITDAGRALQALLGIIGCEGNTVGAQLRDARKRGLLAPHDSTFAAILDKTAEWVSADRSEKGDAHKHSQVDSDDAWFTVHVVGALILRLSSGART